jgi:hypothetical protein
MQIPAFIAGKLRQKVAGRGVGGRLAGSAHLPFGGLTGVTVGGNGDQ